MAVTTASPYDTITAALWNQLAGLINGTTGYGNPILATALSSNSFWSGTFRNQGSAGQALRAQNSGATVDLLTVANAGTTVLQNATTAALTVQNTHSGSHALNVKNADGDSVLQVTRGAGGNDIVNINMQDDTIADATTLTVADSVAASWLVASVTLVQTGNSYDSAAIRGTAYQTSGGSAMRALEGRAIRTDTATLGWTWGMELNVSSKVAGVAFNDLVGAYIACGTAAAGELQGNTGVLITGRAQGTSSTAGGWERFIRCMARDTTTTLWSVTEAGATLAGDGAVGAPSLSFVNSPTTGFYRGASNNITVATAGTVRGNWDQSGNYYHGTGGAALATNASNGFLMIPTMAGAYTGTPPSYTGVAILAIDTTNGRLYSYYGGAPHYLTFT